MQSTSCSSRGRRITSSQNFDFVKYFLYVYRTSYHFQLELRLCSVLAVCLLSGSKRVVNFPWKSLQRSRENYSRNFGLSLRETNRLKKKKKKKSSFQNHSVLDLECRILSQEPSDSFILYFNAIFHGKQAEEDTNRPLVTSEYCED